VTEDHLGQDLLALAATLDPTEAEALRELFAIAGALEFEPDSDEEDYVPFVYPH
jgi:hypothetical protein